jgi:hypothetical protein
MQKLSIITCALILFALASCGKKGGAAPDPSGSAKGTSTSATCAGTIVGGYCWYAGADGNSCTIACSAHGGYNAATQSYAGSATGSDTNCLAVLVALNLGAGAISDFAFGGFGCFAGSNTSRFWSTNPADASTSANNNLRACACNN